MGLLQWLLHLALTWLCYGALSMLIYGTLSRICQGVWMDRTPKQVQFFGVSRRMKTAYADCCMILGLVFLFLLPYPYMGRDTVYGLYMLSQQPALYQLSFWCVIAISTLVIGGLSGFFWWIIVRFGLPIAGGRRAEPWEGTRSRMLGIFVAIWFALFYISIAVGVMGEKTIK